MIFHCIYATKACLTHNVANSAKNSTHHMEQSCGTNAAPAPLAGVSGNTYSPPPTSCTFLMVRAGFLLSLSDRDMGFLFRFLEALTGLGIVGEVQGALRDLACCPAFAKPLHTLRPTPLLEF